jgi:hypothetical protein
MLKGGLEGPLFRIIPSSAIPLRLVQHHEIALCLTYKAESRIVQVRKRKFFIEPLNLCNSLTLFNYLVYGLAMGAYDGIQQ